MKFKENILISNDLLRRLNYHYKYYFKCCLHYINKNKMDFKSRFEGRKAFINKSGNIADPQTKQITVLKKPTQTRDPEPPNHVNRLEQPTVSFGARGGQGGQGDQQIASALNEWRKE